MCGNGSCENGESNTSCPSDCPNAGPICGNGTCESGEDMTNCPGDCTTSSGTLDCSDFVTLIACFGCISDPTTCAPPFTQADCAVCVPAMPSLCAGGAPDMVCDAAAGEDNSTCPEDCP